MGKALYRKHRPKTLAEVVGQEHITDTLTHALQNDRISHAYLFTGPRGVGKTSVARILAHQINKLPYTDESSHLDIIEIDAASNNGVEDVRALRERIAVAPIEAKYKVYIIDEVHMLSKPAFNALLKTLEEPPAHVVFILATTETHKLPETIISRTQRFGFKPVDYVQVVAHLKNIASQEQISIDESALKLIAEHGMGSFRDSISLLDQIGNTSSAITADTVRQSLGQAPEDSVTNVVAAIASHDIAALAEELNSLRKNGIQPSQFAKQLSDRMRNDIVKQTSAITTPEALSLLGQLLEIPSASDQEIALELALYGATLVDQPTTSTNAPRPEPASTNQHTTIEKPHAHKKSKPQSPDTKPTNIKPKPSKKVSTTDTVYTSPNQPEEPTKNPVPDHKDPPATTANGQINTLTQEQWQEVLNTLKGNHNTLYGITRMGIPEFEPGIVTLKFKFAFHQKRLKEEKTRHLLEQTIFKIAGQNHQLNPIHAKSEESNKQHSTAEHTSTDDASLGIEETQEKPDIVNISNIFGGAEIVK